MASTRWDKMHFFNGLQDGTKCIFSTVHNSCSLEDITLIFRAMKLTYLPYQQSTFEVITDTGSFTIQDMKMCCCK